jgi:hypothetical protein
MTNSIKEISKKISIVPQINNESVCFRMDIDFSTTIQVNMHIGKGSISIFIW